MDLVPVERRTSSPAGYLDPLTGLRGFAALWVYLFHVWTDAGPRLMEVGVAGVTLDLTPLFSTGWLGAELFYVLSGFLLAMAFVQAREDGRGLPSLSIYARRRLLRVLPAYYAQIAILLLLAWLGVMGAVPSLASIGLHLLMLHNLWLPFMQEINPVYLTLPVEFDFYVLLPVLALLVVPRRWWRLYLVVLVAVVAYRFAAFQLFSGAAWWRSYRVLVLEQIPGNLDRFVAGMVASWLFLELRRDASLAGLRERLRRWLFPLGAAGVLFLIYFQHWNYEIYWSGGWTLYLWRSITAVFLAATILGAALENPLARRLLANRAALLLGVVSYSVYLWHVPVLQLLRERGPFAIFPGYQLVPMLVLSLPPVIVVAVLSYRWIEYPFLERSHRVRMRHAREAEPGSRAV